MKIILHSPPAVIAAVEALESGVTLSSLRGDRLRILKRSNRKQAKLSLILLDWGVRESFHLLHYLKNQTAPRDAFEVILIEYYDHVSEPAKTFESEIDTWVLLEMPRDCYYHKHLMYNAGVVFSQGEILMFGDSDAMVKPSFIATILQAFERDPLIVYHVDEFRNVRRDLYPFNYPSFEEVAGDGCINDIDGKTKGILDQIDPIHSRNYGACMCAWRKDIVAVGGADEDLTYLGHICGPYDMTFRLMNFGRRLVWEEEEYLFHTWHPGTDGFDNYLGPHDGKNMSTTAFQAMCTGRVPPWVENKAIQHLRRGLPAQDTDLQDLLIDAQYAAAFQRSRLAGPVATQPSEASSPNPKRLHAFYKGYDFYRVENSFYAVPESRERPDLEGADWRAMDGVLHGSSFRELRDHLDAPGSATRVTLIETVGSTNICSIGRRFAVVPHALGQTDFDNPAYRDDPRIVWAESLGDALRTAARSGLEAPPLDQPNVTGSGVIRQVGQLQDAVAVLRYRLAAVESDVSGIYRSRTWRILVRVGHVLQKIAGMIGFRRQDGRPFPRRRS
jgi:hypothetical protein